MSLLIYSKLEPASGNATSAERLAALFGADEPVIVRGLAPELPDDAMALGKEVEALRQLAEDQQITLAIGIHCYRAGVVLHAAFAGRLPYLLIASGTDLNVDWSPRDSLRLQKNPTNAALRAAVADSGGIVALSPDLHTKAAALIAELPAERRPPLVLIPQAPNIDTSSTYSLRAALGLQPEQKLILLPAGIRPVKGVALAIESTAQALLEHPDHVFVILGPPLDANYHAHCASLIGEWRLRHRTLKGRLHLRDGLPRADYLAALREADLLLNTSESEAVANAVLEAQGVGIPVLARNIPGNRAAIEDRVTGWLFDDLNGFLQAYRHIFADPDSRRRIIAAGQDSYRRHCDPKTEALAYRQLVTRARAPEQAGGSRPQLK